MDKVIDISLTKEGKWFRYRAAAIIVEDGCVLLAGNALENYFYSVGGAVHTGEPAEQAVVREVYEETGIQYEIDHLAVIHENFFEEDNGTLAGLDCHEIALYFMMKSKGSQELKSNSFTQGVKEEMHWIPIKDLKNYKHFPTFLSEYLNSEHSGVEHIVTNEKSQKKLDLQPL